MISICEEAMKGEGLTQLGDYSKKSRKYLRVNRLKYKYVLAI